MSEDPPSHRDRPALGAGGRRPPRWVTGVAAGAGAGAVVLGLDLLHVWQGWPGPVAVVVAVLALPVARDLAGRLVLTGTILVGWWPLTWWVAAPGHLSRVGLGLAVVAVVLGWFLAGERGRLRRLIPRWAGTDLLWVGAGVFAAWLYRPWLAPGSSAGALQLMLPGWDHSAHFSITAMQRRFGTVISMAPPAPVGDTWSYSRYPQSGHSLVATVLDLQNGPGGAIDPADYTRAVGLLWVALVVLAVAGVVALPWLRRRWWVAAPAAAAITAVLVLGPGASTLRDGFPPYLVVLGLLAVLPFLALPADRVVDPIRLLAVGGALIGIAHGWTLALALALPMVVAMLLPLRRSRWGASATAWGAAVVVVLATAAIGVAAYLMVAGGVALSEMVTIGGGVTVVGGRVLLAVGAVSGIATVAAVLRARGRGDAVLMRAGALVGVPAVATLVAVWILAQQPDGSSPGYYFHKFSAAAAVAMVAVAVAALSALVPVVDGGSRVASPTVTGRRVLVGLVATGLAVSAFGLPVPGAPGQAPGARNRVGDLAMVRDEGDYHAFVLPILEAAASTTEMPGRQVVLLPRGPVTGIQGAQWVNALSGRWTDEANELLLAIHPWAPIEEFPTTAGRVMADPDTYVLVPPADLDRVRAGVPPDLAARVLAW